MNADTPRDHRHRGAPLLRTTDYARRVLRGAQLGLAVLAVPISVTVGIVVAGSEPSPQVVTSVSGPVLAEPSAGTAEMSLVAPPPTAAEPGSGFADDERAMLGTAAGLVTLTICWLILGIVSMFWRHRLDQHDMRGWADGWARVEPEWSDRAR